jgi:hypothetical protein
MHSYIIYLTVVHESPELCMQRLFEARASYANVLHPTMLDDVERLRARLGLTFGGSA